MTFILTISHVCMCKLVYMKICVRIRICTVGLELQQRGNFFLLFNFHWTSGPQCPVDVDPSFIV